MRSYHSKSNLLDIYTYTYTYKERGLQGMSKADKEKSISAKDYSGSGSNP